MAPCGCVEAKAIREFAEARGRRMHEGEAIEALAHDLGMTVEEVERAVRNRRALASWRRQHSLDTA